jgi:cellulose synthase/poly-beta-1,6-N-acetylglucosamine synthase-like glycosyltransferase
MQIMILVVFLVCISGVLYTYAAYPLLIWLLARVCGRQIEAPPVNPGELPKVSVLIAAHNEEAVIEQRIQNALAADYPSEKLEIVIASDGSCDGTPEIVRRYADRGVRLLNYVQRRGKASTLNSAFPELKGEIVLLSDANTHIDPMAVRNIIRWFRDPDVGIVCGRLMLTSAYTGGNADGLYWKYETFLKRCEARLGAILGANGAIYAIRRELYAPIPDDTVIDDFVIPLLAKQRAGCAIMYDCDAVAWEETAPDIWSEFHRRARIGAGGFHAMVLLWKLLDPRRGWIALTFFSHKVLRWLCPFLLLASLLSSLLLSDGFVYRCALIGQLGFYLASLAGVFMPVEMRFSRFSRLLLAGSMFTCMNAALLVGFWRWLRGTQKGKWKPTARLSIPQKVVWGSR